MDDYRAAIAGLLLMLGVVVAAFFIYFYLMGYCSFWIESPRTFILVCSHR